MSEVRFDEEDPMAESAEPTQADGPAGIRAHLMLLRRSWWLILLTVAVAVGVTFFLTNRQERMYSATAKVQLRTNQTVSLFPFASTGPLELFRSTETERIYASTSAFADIASVDSPSGPTVWVRPSENDLEFRSSGSIPSDVADAANAWAEAYVRQRQLDFERETNEGITFIEQSLTELGAEREAIRAEVARYEALLDETTDPDQYSRILSQKVSIETLLQPQLNPIDQQIVEFGRELAGLQLVTRFLGEPDVSARVVKAATTPSSPSSPNLQRNLALAGLLGLGLGLALPYLRQALNDRVDNTDQVADTTGMTILGSIPTFRPEEGAWIEVVEHPLSVPSERYQAVLTAIEFAAADRPVASILFTSASPSEGKTTTAVNIAALAAKHMNVILVDADLRRSNVHQVAGLPNTAGLSEVLGGEAEIEDARQRFDAGGVQFDVLTAGIATADPALLLRGKAWPDLLADLFVYDLVVVDAPPVLAVTDALLLGREVDGQILVSRAGETSRRELAEAVALLDSNRSRSLGVVLNRDRATGRRYSYYGEYNGQSA